MTRDGAEGAREIRTDHREREIVEKRRLKRKKWIGNESVMGPRGRLFKRGREAGRKDYTDRTVKGFSC